MTLYTKCIFHPKSPKDGLRISVMSRHTLNDGVTPDLRITPDIFDLHMPLLAPQPNLLGDYYKRNLPWKEFEARYLFYLRNNRTFRDVRKLAIQALKRDITLLCVEETPEHCHRRLLAEECQRYRSALQIIHR